MESSKTCTNCANENMFESCIDRTYNCKYCNASIKGINAFRSYEQRIEYYHQILLDCTRLNTLILIPSCSIIAGFCADPPRFNVGDKIDYFHSTSNHFMQTKVINIKYDLFEIVSIEISDALRGAMNMNMDNINNELWINAYDENLEILNIVQPQDNKDCIDVLCGMCKCKLYENLSPFKYVIGEPTQSHFSFELFTNIEPIQDNVCKLNDNESMLNCKNDCHSPLWLIDHMSGYINLNGYQYGLACGRTYAFIEINEDHKDRIDKQGKIDSIDSL